MSPALKTMQPIRRALISVYDKRGLIPFAKGLHRLGVEIVSTGRTHQALKKARIPSKEVSRLTGFPEMLGGRVKTLHPKIHGGILARRDLTAHLQMLKKYRIPQIDMVAVSLYPFEMTLKSAKSHQDKVEMIDIGGPALLRAAAKNFDSVASICDVNDYALVLKEIQSRNGYLSRETLQRLAAKVFQRVSEYDRLIGGYLSNHGEVACVGNSRQAFPAKINMKFEKMHDLRYGENPHQAAAIYRELYSAEIGLCDAEVLGGKELSYNNYLDLEAAWSLVSSFHQTASCVIKHNSPCGFALDSRADRAFKKARRTDPLSAFGGIVGFNRRVNGAAAKALLNGGFIECIVAPDFDAPALNILKIKKNMRLVKITSKKAHPGSEYKRITGGVLVQDRDLTSLRGRDLKIVTRKKPAASQMDDLLVGFHLTRFVKSNAIIVIKNQETMGIGTGQPSRVDSAIHAFRKAGTRSKGASLASDGFFPKPDSIELAAKAGIRAIIQPGGSKGDAQVIDACNRNGISMVFTGIRHFTH